MPISSFGPGVLGLGSSSASWTDIRTHVLKPLLNLYEALRKLSVRNCFYEINVRPSTFTPNPSISRISQKLDVREFSFHMLFAHIHRAFWW